MPQLDSTILQVQVNSLIVFFFWLFCISEVFTAFIEFFFKVEI